MKLSNWNRAFTDVGSGLAIDVGITDPVSRFASSKSSFETLCEGLFGSKYYDLKMKKFGYEDIEFCPIIFESFWYIDPRSRKVLDDIIKLAAKNMNKDFSKIKTFIYTRIGISLSRSDAQAGVARYYYNFSYNYDNL